MLALGYSAAAWSAPIPIESSANPAADAIALPAGSKDKALEELPQIIKNIMRRSHVPGMAVAVVMNGKMVFANGYGTRELGKEKPVDAHTVFQVASVSKSISATITALEVTKGTVTWNDPIVKYLPDFKLSSAYVSTHATIGDCFAHRTGLPETAGDDLEDLGFTRREVISRLRLLPLDAFRTSYHYANFSTTTAAQAVAAAAGMPWEKLAEQALFKPLAMKSTSYRYADFMKHKDRATLHAYKNGHFVPAGTNNVDQQAPAGGVSTNVIDLAKWLKLLLADGKYNGKQMIAPAALLPALSPESFSARPHDILARPGFYGYGFNVGVEMDGRTVMGHSGAFLMGTGTAFRIIPSVGVGIVVLTNGAPVGAAESVVADFTDTVLYGTPTRDWFKAYNGVMMGFFQPQADLSAQAKPANPIPAKTLSVYVGQFTNPYYGSAIIEEKNGALTLVLGPKHMRFPLQHWDNNTFAFAPAGEAELVDSTASIVFKVDKDHATDFYIKFYDDNGLGHWARTSAR